MRRGSRASEKERERERERGGGANLAFSGLANNAAGIIIVTAPRCVVLYRYSLTTATRSWWACNVVSMYGYGGGKNYKRSSYARSG